MLASLDWLGTAARDADVAMVYFAGHSIQVGPEHYIIGADLAEVSAPAVAASNVTLAEIRSAIDSAGADLSLIVLDACRNNPLGDTAVGRVGLAPTAGAA